MYPGHIQSLTVGGLDFFNNLVQMHRCRIQNTCSGSGLGNDRFRHQRARIEHHRGGFDEIEPAYRNQVSGTGAGSDKMHSHFATSCFLLA